MRFLGSFLWILAFLIAFVSCAPQPTAIRVDPGAVVLLAKDEMTRLHATVLDAKGRPIPNQKAVWVSSDSNVAIVANGEVKAVGSGEATISAMSGSLVCTATAKVNICNKIDIIPEVIHLDVGETIPLQIHAFNEKGGLIADAAPNWTVGNPQIARITAKGEVTRTQAGETMIIATYGGVSAKAVVMSKIQTVPAKGVSAKVHGKGTKTDAGDADQGFFKNILDKIKITDGQKKSK